MSKQDSLETLAEHYRDEGYEVLVRPPGPALPAFLEGSSVDILARKGERVVALTMKEGVLPADSEGGLSLLTAHLAHLDGDYGKSLLAEAERLLSPDTLRAALLMGWAAFEAAARQTLAREIPESDKLPPRALMESLLTRRHIKDEDFTSLQVCFSLRNMLAHGVRPDDISPEIPTFLLELVRRLLMIVRTDNTIRFGAMASATLFRSKLNQSDLLRLAEQASEALGEIMGSLRGGVSEEWDLAVDADGEPMVALKLSDPTGKVAATFEPPELEDKRHMVVRLNRLWGDLLQIRSHVQLEAHYSPHNDAFENSGRKNRRGFRTCQHDLGAP